MWPVLQVALDLTDIEEAIRIGLKAVEGGFDWVEAGTPLIKSVGMESIGALRRAFPENIIIADMKTVDTGELELKLAAEAGADVVSVLGGASDETVKEVIAASDRYDVKVLADLISVADPVHRSRELERMGVDYVGVHTGIDQQKLGEGPLKVLSSVVKSVDIPVSVAGGLDAKTVPKAVKAGGSIIVVGGAVTGAKDLKEAVEGIFRSVR